MENKEANQSGKGEGTLMNQSQFTTGDIQVVVQPNVLSLSELMNNGKTELKIMNPLSHSVEYKLRCNAPEYYSAHRTSGEIGPQSSVTLRILLKEGFDKDSDDVHKFLIKVGHGEKTGKKVLFIEDDRNKTAAVSTSNEPSEKHETGHEERKSHGWMLTTGLGFIVSLSLPALLQWEGNVPARIVMSFVAGVSLALVLSR